MRIGIDARFLTHPQEGGFKSYSESLIQGLCELDTANDYVLYVDREPVNLQLPNTSNYRVKTVATGNAFFREQYLLPKAMKADKLDAVHFLCNTAPVSLAIKSIVTIHDLIPYKRKPQQKSLKANLLYRYWRYIIPFAAKQAEHIITVSRASKADICTTLKIPSKKVTVIPTGYHPAFRVLPNDRDTGRMCRRLGLFGRFVLGFASSDPRKNVAVYLSAMAMVRRRIPDCRAVVVCSSEAVEDEVRFLSQGLIPDSALTLLSGLSRPDLAMVYNLAEVVLFPSLYEGFGLPVIEAMACGTPVVTSNISSLPEVAGDAGILVNPKDPAESADAVVKLLTDETLWKQKKAAGLENARLYEWHRIVESTIRLYEMVGKQQHCVCSSLTRSLGGEAR